MIEIEILIEVVFDANLFIIYSYSVQLNRDRSLLRGKIENAAVNAVGVFIPFK